jgi:pyruvate kinase
VGERPRCCLASAPGHRARPPCPQVVATLGPACHDVDTLVQLLEAGMTVARVDLTWGHLDFHMHSLANLHEAMRRVRRMCAVMVRAARRQHASPR